MTPDGVWLELSWDRPQKLREVQITFDTGFQRELTLTSNPSINIGILREAQPETVRDYRLLIPNGSDWKELTKVSNNYQRLNRHGFDPVETDRLRLHITATNGDEFARVFEIRCYA
jgi:hypothetical protein